MQTTSLALVLVLLVCFTFASLTTRVYYSTAATTTTEVVEEEAEVAAIPTKPKQIISEAVERTTIPIPSRGFQRIGNKCRTR